MLRKPPPPTISNAAITGWDVPQFVEVLDGKVGFFRNTAVNAMQIVDAPAKGVATIS
jgi:hypothetical protein